MYSVSVCLFRHLRRFKHVQIFVGQRPLKQIYKNFYLKNFAVRQTTTLAKDECGQVPLESRDNLKAEDFTAAVKLINKYSSSESVQWEDVMKELIDLNISNPRNLIILTCVKLEKLDIGMSYYKYLSERREDLSPDELLFFIKLLYQSIDELPKFSEVVEDFYEKFKIYTFSSSLIKHYALSVFLKFPNCFWDCVKNARADEERRVNQPIVHRAFEIDEPEVAWDFIQDVDFFFSNEFLRVYINYCIRKAINGKFSVDLINDLVNICVKKFCCLNFNNLEYELGPLIEAVKNNKNDYSLTVERCEINNENICSNCGLKLLDVPIQKEELDALKDDFFDAAINNNLIFVHSSKKEVNNFKCFLENCHPYNLVIDGLNLLYIGRTVGVKHYSHMLKFFLDKNFKILIIARNHSKRFLTKPPYLKLPKYRQNIQFFFTSDMSDDDLFTLYSAMHGGPNTFFCSGDHLNPYKVKLTQEKQILFDKWKISHQYLIKPDRTLLSPWTCMGLPQLTAAPNKKNKGYVWHLSHVLSDTPLCRNKHINWACMTAIPKKRTK